MLSIHHTLTCFRISFRQALEGHEQWCEETVARTQYHLGLILVAKSDPTEGKALLSEAQRSKDRLWKAHADYIPSDVIFNDEEAFDHLASSDFGRSTSKPMVRPRLLLDNFCKNVSNNIRNLSSEIVEPEDMIHCLKAKGSFLDLRSGGQDTTIFQEIAS